MKFKLKRGLAAFLVIVMAVCLVLTGCGNSEENLNNEFTSKQTDAADNNDKADSASNEADIGDEDDESADSTEKPNGSATSKPSEEDEDDSNNSEDKTDSTNSSNDESKNESTSTDAAGDESNSADIDKEYAADPEGIPPFADKAYIELNGNFPEFKESELTTQSYEFYSELDSLGRCGYVMACIGKDLMPTEDRGSLTSVTPSGWVNNRYDTSLVSGGYIYNRCHLIGFQLTGEVANAKNLITGTRYLNIDGMLPFENMVADYVKETENHVMYRVTPIYVGDNLVASGVQIEAYSVEDNGASICFNVYAYNVQPGITINYVTGDNWIAGSKNPTGDKADVTESSAATETKAEDATDTTAGGESGTTAQKYVLNTGTKRIHYSDCSSAKNISEANRKEYEGSLEEYINAGYLGCKTCNPI